MTFWKTLRWICALLYVAIVAIAWFGSSTNFPGASEVDPNIRPAPLIVR